VAERRDRGELRRKKRSPTEGVGQRSKGEILEEGYSERGREVSGLSDKKALSKRRLKKKTPLCRGVGILERDVWVVFWSCWGRSRSFSLYRSWREVEIVYDKLEGDSFLLSVKIFPDLFPNFTCCNNRLSFEGCLLVIVLVGNPFYDVVELCLTVFPGLRRFVVHTFLYGDTHINGEAIF
jgi:hypothetical protein